MNNLLAVFIGGGAGSLIRYLISWGFQRFYITSFPLATLISNLVSCIILGSTLALLASKAEESTVLKPLIMVGFCGGLSTFSTFSYENVELFRAGSYGWLAFNIATSVLCCFAILYVLAKK